MTDIPQIGSVWQHTNGSLYIVEDVRNTSDALDPERYPVMVCYRQLKDEKGLGKLSKPIDRWFKGMTKL